MNKGNGMDKLVAALAALMMGTTVHAATVDYLVSTQVNGFDVYKVTKDSISLVSAVSVPKLTYVWNDIAAGYIYAVVSVPTNPVSSRSNIVSYALNSGYPKKVASIADTEIGNNDQYGVAINGVFASPEHLVISLIDTGPQYPYQRAHVYHKEAGGTLKFWCDLSLDVGQLKDIRIDPNEIYAYVNWTNTAASPATTAIYDISQTTCNLVGQITP